MIRRLCGADAAAYQALRLEGLRESPDAFGRTVEEVAEQPVAEIASVLERHAIFGASSDGDALVGIAGLVVLDGVRRSHKASLFGMYVRPEARGQGVAAALIDAIVAEARECVEEIQLTVGATNAGARALYERAGFRAYGYERRALRLGSTFSDEIAMALSFRGDARGLAPPDGSSGPRKRSITIAGHETSISLEPVFWAALEAAARAQALPLSALVARVDAERIKSANPPNLASAIRVWLFERN